ncbi:hypothetical protein ACOBR2_20705 [Telmatobacter bradus]|uniref:hypothetical protein n=1 Tax=Telmatobacter bradus TaxID=474953 RepID=UPI003B43909C
MTVSDWISIVGTVASIIGLIVSWFAWRQAKGAKKAAEEASSAVKARDTAHEFSKLATDAKDLLAAVQGEQKELAIAAANDLTHLLAIAVSRRASYLPQEFDPDLYISNLQRISRSIGSEGFADDLRKKNQLLDRCHQIHRSLCGIAGVVERYTEERDK